MNSKIEILQAHDELISSFGKWDVLITQTKQSKIEVLFKYEYKFLFNKCLMN